MGFLSKLIEKLDSNGENAADVIQSKSADIIKELSGADIKVPKRMVDNVVVFTSASGGAGASTIVANVAYEISRKGFNVLLIDLNIMYPVQHMLFGVDQDKDNPTVMKVLKGKSSAAQLLGITEKMSEDDIVTYLMGKASIGECIDTSSHVGLMYSHNRSLVDYINCEGEMAVRNLEELLEKSRQLFDIILIDCPMRIDNTLINSAFYGCDQIYLVWDEGISSISNTEKIRRNMALTGIDAYTKLRVILNKKTDVHYTKYPFDKLNVELAQILPFDSAIIESSLKSQIFVKSGSSTSKSANVFYNGIGSLAGTILENGGYME